MRLPRFALRGAVLAAAIAGLSSVFFILRADADPESAPVTASPPTVPSPAVSEHLVEKDGLAVRFSLRDSFSGGAAMSARPAVATLTLTDARSGAPVRGARPRAWLQRASGAPLDGDACHGAIRAHMGGLLSVQADVDLNAAWLLVMNEDATIGVLNPHVSFSRTKLRSIVSLPGRAADWALHPDRERLFVSIPATGEVVTVDTRRFLVARRLEVGEGAGRLTLAPDGSRLFVSREGSGELVVVDTTSSSVAHRLDVGEGPHSLAFSEQGRRLWIAAAGGRSLRVLDALTLDAVGELELGEGTTALAASDPAGAVIAANGRSGKLFVIDAAGVGVRAELEAESGWNEVRFDPSGRWALAVNRGRGTASVIDASSGKDRVALTGLGAPHAVTFTRAYAYLRDASQPRLWLLRLDALERAGTPGVAEVAVGQSAPGGGEELAGPLVRTTENDGVISVSHADRALFFYREGMMAPMGSIRNSGREPRAVLLLDRALREIDPGVYRTQVELGLSGDHDLAVLVDAPRVGACLRLTVPPSPDERRRDPGHAVRFDPQGRWELVASEPGTLRFRVLDGEAQVPAAEVEVLAFRVRDHWRWRGTARPSKEGTIAIDLPPLDAGEITVVVGARRRGAPLGELPPVRVPVRASSLSTLASESPR